MYPFKIFAKFYNVFICLCLFHLGHVSAICAEATKPVRLVDLTHSFDETTIYWPTRKSFELEIVHRGKTEDG